MTARERWKEHWRKVRVLRREQIKAEKDLTLYGTGALMIPPSNRGDPWYVPIENLMLYTASTGWQRARR